MNTLQKEIDTSSIYEFEIRKKKKILTQFSYVSIFIPMIIMLFLFVIAAPIVPKIVAGVLIFSGILSLLLIIKDKIASCAAILFISGPFSIGFLNYFYGSTGAEYCLIPLLILTFYIYRKPAVNIVISVYISLIFIYSKHLESVVIATPIDAANLYVINYINICLSLLISVILLRLFVLEHNKHQITIVDKNLKLQLAINDANDKQNKIEMLYRELNHRIKNNLQLILSIIKMQSKGISDQKTKNTLDDIQNRIFSMALIHQKLYSRNQIDTMLFKEYFTEMINHLVDALDNKENPVKIKHDIDEIEVKTDNAIHLGLILNEILTNSFKHCSNNGNEGFIDVTVKKLKKEGLFISVYDSGNGIGKMKYNNFNSGFGSKLIYALTNQMQGRIELDENNANGIIIRFDNFSKN